MADITALKDYFKKLQRIVNLESSFKFFGKSYIKKSRMDDILCCLIASMPDSYKKYVKAEYDKRLSSITSFRTLYEALRHKFFLNSDYYVVDVDQANKLISAIAVSIERDVKFTEENAPSE